MRKLVKRVLLLVSTAGIVVSCSKEELKDPINTAKVDTKDFVVVDGRLKFSSMSSFEETVSSLKKQQNKLNDWESKLDGFTSMNEAYEKLTDADLVKMAETNSTAGYENIVSFVGQGEERELVMTTEDPILATLVNKDGLLQVGDDVYKLAYSKVAKASEANIEKLNQINALNIGQTDGVLVEAVSHSSVGTTTANKTQEQTCIEDYRTGKGLRSTKKRLVGEIYTTSVGQFYSGAGAVTKHQQRILGAWVRKKTQALRLRVTGQFTQYLNGLPAPLQDINFDSGEQPDDGRENFTFDFCVNADCYFIINNATSYHWGRCDDGATRACSLTQ